MGADVLPSCGTPPCVNETLVLQNNTLVGGNDIVPDAIYGWGMAPDPAKGEVFAVDEDSDIVWIINDTTNTVVGNISVGVDPTLDVYDPIQGEIFVSNAGSSFVSVINDTTDVVVAEVPVTGGSLAFDTGKDEAFTGENAVDSVAVISAATNSVVATIPMPGDPNSLTYDKDRGEVFVANGDTDLVSVISDSTNSIVANVTLPTLPDGTAFDSGMGEAAITDGSNLSLISDTTNTVVATIPVGAGGSAVGYDPAHGQIYADTAAGERIVSDISDTVVATLTGVAGEAKYSSNKGEMFVSDERSVNVVNDTTDQIVAVIPLAPTPTAVAVDPGRGDLFVADSSSDDLRVVSATTGALRSAVPVGSAPSAIALDSATGVVFVANSASDNVSVISDSSDTVIANVPVGVGPDALAFDGLTDEIFVANRFSDNVSVLSASTDRVVGSVGVGTSPDGLTFDSAKDEVFVSNAGSNNVSVVFAPGLDVITSIVVDVAPAGLAYDNATGTVFVTNYDSATVSLISDETNSVVGTSSVEGEPDFAAVDPVDGDVYVTNSVSDSVSVLVGTTGQVPSTLIVSVDPEGAVFDPAGQVLFVSNEGDGTVSLYWAGNPPGPLTVSAGDSISSGPIFLHENFTAAASGGTGTYTQWEWHFGDGQTSTQQAPSHIYESEGSYLAWVNVTDSSGSSAQSNELRITVEAPVPTLEGVEVLPGSATVQVDGSTAAFTAITSCSTTCPTSGISYAWSLTQGSLGTLSSPSSDSTRFEAGPNPGELALFVNATLNGRTEQAGPVEITVTTAPPPVLIGVSVSPGSATLDTFGSLVFRATPQCDGTCPNGTAYAWVLSVGSPGEISSSEGNSTTFQAGPSPGSASLDLSATLNSETAQTVVDLTVQGIAEVELSPTEGTLTEGTALPFTATAFCSTSSFGFAGEFDCPPPTSYQWELESPLGQLNTTIGTVVDLVAGTAPGSTLLYVNATFAGRSVLASARITVVAGPVYTKPPQTGTFDTEVVLIALPVATMVVLAAWIFLVRRSKKEFTEAAPERFQYAPLHQDVTGGSGESGSPSDPGPGREPPFQP